MRTSTRRRLSPSPVDFHFYLSQTAARHFDLMVDACLKTGVTTPRGIVAVARRLAISGSREAPFPLAMEFSDLAKALSRHRAAALASAELALLRHRMTGGGE